MSNYKARWDEPVFDGEWCFDNDTTTYWSPIDMIDDTYPYNIEPYYEPIYGIIHKNRFRTY